VYAKPDTSWEAQLAKGQRAELRLADYYIRRGFVAAVVRGRCSEADIIIKKGGHYWAVEVKDCAGAFKYGFFPVEHSYKQKPSGLETTGADIWAFVAGSEAYAIATQKLRELIGNGGYETKSMCHGETQCWLVPIADVEACGKRLKLMPPDAISRPWKQRWPTGRQVGHPE
jgi:Holliday junction resolvase-like predicted endonuclease